MLSKVEQLAWAYQLAIDEKKEAKEIKEAGTRLLVAIREKRKLEAERRASQGIRGRKSLELPPIAEIKKMLVQEKGGYTEVARKLGCSRKTLYNRLEGK